MAATFTHDAILSGPPWVSQVTDFGRVHVHLAGRSQHPAITVGTAEEAQRLAAAFLEAAKRLQAAEIRAIHNAAKEAR